MEAVDALAFGVLFVLILCFIGWVIVRGMKDERSEVLRRLQGQLEDTHRKMERAARRGQHGLVEIYEKEAEHLVALIEMETKR